MSKLLNLVVIVVALILLSNHKIEAQSSKIEEPVLITSCGQSPGPLKLKVFMKKSNYNFEYELQAKKDLLTSKKFKSLIIVTGASLKGMGAAGVSIKDELARVNALITEAKKQKIKIIAAHIEGKARRAQASESGDNSDELSIDAVCPFADLIIVRSDGNEDGRFSAIAKEKNIPLKSFEKNLDLSNLLDEIYNK